MRTHFLHAPHRGAVSPAATVPETFDYYIGPSGSDSNPGTIGSPWAITALWTKASTYAGKRLGLLDGTYSGYNGGTYNSDDYAHYIPPAAGGSASVPTVISAVNARQVTLNGAGGNGGGGFTRARIVVHCAGAYVTLKGLTVNEGAYYGIQVAADTVRVERCHVHDIDRVAYGVGGTDNTATIDLTVGSSNAYIGHNYLHDIVTSDGTHRSCVLMYNGTNAVVECNDCTDSEVGVQLKQNDGGAIVRYNYIHALKHPLLYGTNDAFAFTVYGNVIEGWTGNGYARDNYSESSGTTFYNNTFIVSSTGQAGILFVVNTGNPLTFYNNMVVRSGGSSSEYGDMNAGGSGTFALSDYNLYGTTATLHSPNGTPRTFAAYKTQIGGLDAHSLNSDPTFVGGGSGPYQWKLSGGSAGEGAGSSDGTTGGSAVNIGAFRSSGQTEQIGPDWRWPA